MTDLNLSAQASQAGSPTAQPLSARRILLLIAAIGLLTSVALFTNQTGISARGMHRGGPGPTGITQPAQSPNSLDSDTAQKPLAAYNAGRFAEAESQAGRLLRRSPGPKSEERARARWVQAFAAARQGEYTEALERFSLLRKESAGERWTLEPERPPLGRPNAGSSGQAAEPAPPVGIDGQPLPTLEEEAAYQHAVLTSAIATGRVRPAHAGSRPTRARAEQLFMEFMKMYPESPLVHAAVRRIGLLHEGEIPDAAADAWRRATALAGQRAEGRAARASACGPEVLAEAFRRLGIGGPEVEPERLAVEMKTSSRGTTLAAMAKAAAARGCTARGLLREEAGLREILANAGEGQVLIALIAPAHYVILERWQGAEVRYWDPSSSEPRTREDLPGGAPGRRAAPDFLWRKNWRGQLLLVERNDFQRPADRQG